MNVSVNEKKYFTCSGTQLTPEIRMPAIRRMGGPRQDQYPGPGLKVYHQNQNTCSNIFSNRFPLLLWIFTILEATCPQRAAATTASLLVNSVTWLLNSDLLKSSKSQIEAHQYIQYVQYYIQYILASELPRSSKLQIKSLQYIHGLKCLARKITHHAQSLATYK